MLRILTIASIIITTLSQELMEGCVDVEGVKHKPNDSYIGPDGCNRCRCIQGSNACTKIFCDPKTPRIAAEANQCIDNKGNLHEEGESYTHVDGCNTCICRSYGGACTKKFCFKELKEDNLCKDPQGNSKEIGDIWTAEDNCNRCQCGIMGPICTHTKCISHKPEKQPRDGEVVDETGDSPCRGEDGTTKFPGETWLTSDQCNICTCTGVNGKAECTAEGCRARFMKLMSADKPEEGNGSSRITMATSLVLAVLLFALV